MAIQYQEGSPARLEGGETQRSLAIQRVAYFRPGAWPTPPVASTPHRASFSTIPGCSLELFSVYEVPSLDARRFSGPLLGTVV
ncbi:hypothetical protein VTH06DRAFT_6114 [Thermothelomyces fergusii]